MIDITHETNDIYCFDPKNKNWIIIDEDSSYY